MEKLESILFYSIDRAIRTYRQYAQQQLKKAGYSITIDQWLIIKCILENPTITQQEIGEIAFKDNASVTRIIELLVKAKYLKRKQDKQDRRRFKLEVTDLGIHTIYAVNDIVLENRKFALQGINESQINETQLVLDQITVNCK